MNNKDTSLKIFVSYHKPYFLCKNEFMCPVQGGRAIIGRADKDGMLNALQRQWMLENTSGDDSGENISHLNRNFNEMTVEYWVWKNYELLGNPDYVGFMQYRRQFVFNRDFNKIPRSDYDRCYSMFKIDHPDKDYFDIIGLSKDNILKELDGYDVVMPKMTDFSLIGLKSVREDFATRIPGTHIEDFDKFTAYLKNLHPDFGDYFEKMSYGTSKHLYLCFIASKDVFKAYADFIFPILLDFNKQLDVSNYTVNGQRTIGYLSETLCSAYFEYMKAKQGYKIKELDIAMIQDNDLVLENNLKLWRRYLKYGLLSKILCGEARRKYKQKRKIYKQKIKSKGKMLVNGKEFRRWL